MLKIVEDKKTWFAKDEKDFIRQVKKRADVANFVIWDCHTADELISIHCDSRIPDNIESMDDEDILLFDHAYYYLLFKDFGDAHKLYRADYSPGFEDGEWQDREIDEFDAYVDYLKFLTVNRVEIFKTTYSEEPLVVSWHVKKDQDAVKNRQYHL